MHRLLLVVHLAVIALSLLGCRSYQRGGDALAYDDLSYTQPEVNDTARRRLAAPVTVEAGTYTLVDLGRLIQRQTGVPVRFQWDGLAELGIGPDEVIEFEPGTLPADRLLATLLLEIAPPKAPSSWALYPTYLLVDGTAVIGTNRSLKPLAAAVDWPEGGPRVIDADEAVRRTLRDTVISTDGQPLALNQAVQLVRDATEVSIVVEWAQLEVVGIDQDMLVYGAEAIRADLFLESILRQAGAEAFDEDKPAYLIDQGVIHISTRGDLREQTSTRVYDVRDVIDRPFGPLLEAVYADDQIAMQLLRDYQLAWLVDLGGVKHVFDLSGALEGRNSADPGILREVEIQWSEIISYRAVALEQLSEFIQDSTGDLDAWLDEEATIRELNGNFVIKASDSTHEQIAFLLDRVRESRAGRVYQFMRDLDIARLLKQAELLRAEGDYEAALELAEAAVAVDPHSVPARAMRQVIADTIVRNRARTGGN